MNIDPALPIYEALVAANRAQQDLVGYEKDGARYVVHRDDLDKMAGMGQDTLPVKSIAIPENSPLLHDERTRLSATADYSRRLSAYFPVYFVAALYELQSLILRFNVQGFVIGGITRDLILFNEKRLEVRDVDVTVEGDAIELAAFLAENSRNFEVVERFPEFGTAKVRYKDSLMFDFASTRQEVYPHCGALPVVVKRGVPLIDDVIRRDFTINALAFAIHELGYVLDYTNGIRDIEQGEIRILHPVSFFEDPSRILRALKFCARFDFELAEETRELLTRFLEYGAPCYKGGGERIKQELKGLLSSTECPAKSRLLRFFLESGCYRLMNMETGYQPTPETIERLLAIGAFVPTVESTISAYIEPDFVFNVYLCFLCRDMAADDFQQIAKRLGLTRNEREFVEQFRKLKGEAPQHFGSLHEFSSPVEIYDLFHGVPLVTSMACLIEAALQSKSLLKGVLEAFLKYKRKWEKMALALDGNDLIELGVPVGREVGRMLDDLLHAKLAGQVPDRMDEIQYVQNRLPKPSEDVSHLSEEAAMTPAKQAGAPDAQQEVSNAQPPV